MDRFQPPLLTTSLLASDETCGKSWLASRCLDGSCQARWPNRLPGCLAARLPGCLAAWLPGCLVAWLPGCLAAWLPGCLPGCLPVWLPAWLPGVQWSTLVLPVKVWDHPMHPCPVHSPGVSDQIQPVVTQAMWRGANEPSLHRTARTRNGCVQDPRRRHPRSPRGSGPHRSEEPRNLRPTKAKRHARRGDAGEGNPAAGPPRRTCKVIYKCCGRGRKSFAPRAGGNASKASARYMTSHTQQGYHKTAHCIKRMPFDMFITPNAVERHCFLDMLSSLFLCASGFKKLTSYWQKRASHIPVNISGLKMKQPFSHAIRLDAAERRWMSREDLPRTRHGMPFAFVVPPRAHGAPTARAGTRNSRARQDAHNHMLSTPFNSDSAWLQFEDCWCPYPVPSASNWIASPSMDRVPLALWFHMSLPLCLSRTLAVQSVASMPPVFAK